MNLKEEIIINKTVNIKGIYVNLIAITSEEDGNVLWAIYKLPYRKHVEENVKKYLSNREEIINSVNKESSFININISEIIIQGQKILSSSSTSIPLYLWKIDNSSKLQNFIDNGLISANLHDSDLENIIITEYKLKDCDELPKIDTTKKLDIILKLRSYSKSIIINQSIHMKFGEMEIENKFEFYDHIQKRKYNYYINNMYHYDVWNEVNNNLEMELGQVVPKEQLEEAKEEYVAALEKICPKGMDLAMLEYESEEDFQLNVYTKGYLNERSENKAAAIALFFKVHKKIGKNGLKSRVCIIKPVDKDFYDDIDIELLTGYIKVPEEIIKV